MSPFLKTHVFLISCTLLTTLVLYGQEFHGHKNHDLNDTRIWNIDNFQIYKLTDAYPYQYLGVSNYRFYLMTTQQNEDDSNEIGLTYIAQNDWLKYRSGRPIISRSISDQRDQNRAWKKNRKKVIKIMHDLDLTRAVNFEYLCKESEHNKWLGESKEFIYQIKDETFSIYKYTAEKEVKATYKSTFFDGKYCQAHKKFKEESYETFFFIEEQNQGVLFQPKEHTFDINDLHEIKGVFNRENNYLLCNWTSPNSIDLIEMADSGVFLFPDIGGQNEVPKILLYENPRIDSNYLDQWQYGELKDLNNDGRLDLILFGEFPAVILNEPNGLVNPQQLGTEGLDAYGLTCADADGDEDLDVIVDAYNGLRIFINEEGDFNHDPIVLGEYYHSFFFLWDLDEDGDKDLLVRKRHDKMYFAEFENGGFKELTEFLIQK